MEWVEKVTLEWMRPEDLHVNPDLNPPRDERFMELAEKCLAGELGLFYAMIPLGCLVPFDLDYRPDLVEAGQAMIQMMIARAHEGKIPLLFTYQRGYWFVVSDDYIALFSAVKGMPDYCGCYILGEPQHPLAREVVQIHPDQVREVILGGHRVIGGSN